jgi:molecular chaperone GrpE
MPEETRQENTEARDAGPAQGEPTAQVEPVTSQTEELQKKLEEAQKAADMYRDQLLRKAADLENYRKRSEIDFINLIKNANEELISAVLPILNDFARSLKFGKDVKDYEAFNRGVELIYNKLLKLLEAQGVVPFESLGKPFDVNYHDALLQIPRTDVPPHTVIEEVEKGYKLNDKVLRHAKVIVSAAEQPPTEPDSQTESTSVPRDGDPQEGGNQ